MTSTGDNSIFIDTNILIYSVLEKSAQHSKAVNHLNNIYDSYTSIWISRQIIKEFIATVTRPQTFSNPLTLDQLFEKVEYFRTNFMVLDEGRNTIDKLMYILNHVSVGGKQIHDANIVATMLTYNITHLLTNNVEDFKRYNNLITIIPLVEKEN